MKSDRKGRNMNDTFSDDRKDKKYVSFKMAVLIERK